MITVTVRVGKEETGTTEAISAPSIREAVAIAQAHYPEEEVRVAYPIDGEAFFSRRTPARPLVTCNRGPQESTPAAWSRSYHW